MSERAGGSSDGDAPARDGEARAGPVKLYAGTTEQFRADARMRRIAEKLRAEDTTQIGHRPAPSEVANRQNSPMTGSMLLDQAELNDHGVLFEEVR